MARFPRLAPASAAVAALLASSLVIAVPAGAERPAATAHFATPSAIASIGPWIVVANHATSTLTILAANGGTPLRYVSHPLLGISGLSAIVAEPVAGRRVAFVGGAGGAVAELALAPKGASVGVLRLRVLRPAGCGSRATTTLAIDAGRLVAACSNGVVTVWQATTGALVRTISARSTHLTDVTGIATLRGDAYLTNAATAAPGSAPDSVTALSLATGQRLRSVTNATSATYAFSSPSAIASDGTHLWESNANGNTVDELAAGSLAFMASSGTNLTAPAVVLATPSYTWVSSASVNGSSSMVTQFYVANHLIMSPWMMCNSNGPYQFGDPSGFTMHGGMLWVANAANNLVDQMNGSTGALVGTYT